MPRDDPLTTPVDDVPDHVIWYACGLALAAVLWFALKSLARRGRMVTAYERLDPVVQAGRAWVAGAPAVFTYMAIWTATSIVQQGQPHRLTDLTAAFSSTNIANLLREPVRVMVTSAVLVADHAVGFLLYVAVFVLVVARLEHRIGAARWLGVAAAAHVLGSLLTVAVERIGLLNDLLPRSIVVTQDVGVSYVMVGSLGAYLWLVTPRWRVPYATALALGILGPLVVWHTIWDLGHFLATVVGTAAGWVALRWPLRDRLVWAGLVGGLAPRPLPTFEATLHRAPPSADRA